MYRGGMKLTGLPNDRHCKWHALFVAADPALVRRVANDNTYLGPSSDGADVHGIYAMTHDFIA